MNKLTVYTGQKHTLYLHAYINTHAHSSTDTYTNHIFEYLPKGINYSTKRGSIFGAVFFSFSSTFCFLLYTTKITFDWNRFLFDSHDEIPIKLYGIYVEKKTQSLTTNV